MISVVVATYNRASILNEHIDSVLKQEGVEYELICVDDGSSDGSPALLEAYRVAYPDRFRCLRVPNGGPGLARNAGAREARGDLLVFTDDDVTVPRDWLLRLRDVFTSHDCGAATGGFAPYAMDTAEERYLHYRMGILFGERPGYVRAAPMMSFLVPNETFWETGGFVQNAIEDWVLCRELQARGHRIYYDPSVKVVHRYQTAWSPMARRMRLQGALGLYDRLDRERWGAPYLAYSAAKYLSSPVWSLWRFPRDLYRMSLRMETVFFAARLKAYLGSFLGRRLGPPDWSALSHYDAGKTPRHAS